MKYFFKRFKRHAAAGFLLIMLCSAVSVKSAHAQGANLLPENFDGGFKQTKPAAFYDQGDLFELINGQAVFYLSYGFDKLEHTFYEKAGNEFIVDVYRLRDTLSALGSFRQQKDDEAEVLAVGTEGYLIDYLSVFYKDRYYIEIIPSDPENENNIADLKLLAAQIEGFIPGSTDLPPEIKMLPDSQDFGMIPDSEMYTGENLLSYTFLGHGLTGEYTQKGGEKTLKVFISFAESADHAKKIVAEFNSKLESSDSVKLTGKVRGFKGELPYRGNSMVFNYKQYAFGCLGCTDEKGALKIFKALLENLD
jgi:hypothetical protein